jgi:hypothetical protein
MMAIYPYLIDLQLEIFKRVILVAEDNHCCREDCGARSNHLVTPNESKPQL